MPPIWSRSSSCLRPRVCMMTFRPPHIKFAASPRFKKDSTAPVLSKTALPSHTVCSDCPCVNRRSCLSYSSVSCTISRHYSLSLLFPQPAVFCGRPKLFRLYLTMLITSEAPRKHQVPRCEFGGVGRQPGLQFFGGINCIQIN